jgi:hypothetical protein
MQIHCVAAQPSFCQIAQVNPPQAVPLKGHDAS